MPKSPLSVITGTPDEGLRPDPPEWMTESQAEQWNAIVQRMPAGYFTAETLPVLAMLCRHIAYSHEMASIIAGSTLELRDCGKKKDHREVRQILEMHERLHDMLLKEDRIIASLCTKLRLTPQSKHDPRQERNKIKKEPEGRRPFQVA
jgi:hypothetical protein